jgi:hypothetical protein
MSNRIYKQPALLVLADMRVRLYAYVQSSSPPYPKNRFQRVQLKAAKAQNRVPGRLEVSNATWAGP